MLGQLGRLVDVEVDAEDRDSPREPSEVVARDTGRAFVNPEAHVWTFRDGKPDLGYTATRQLLEKARPSALICFNDRLAFGAYQALGDAGLEVSADVSVVSFDDDVLASWVRPQLTTIALPHYELGRAAIEALLDGEQQSDGGAGVYQIPMPLRERDSVRRLARSARRPRAQTR